MKFWIGTPILFWGIATIGNTGLFLVLSILCILIGGSILLNGEFNKRNLSNDEWEEVQHARKR